LAVGVLASTASAYVYGWDPAKDQGQDFYCELAQDPSIIYGGVYAGKFEYFFDFYIVGTGGGDSTTYNLGLVGLDNTKIANAQTINPDSEVFKTQEWGQPNGYGNRASWSDSHGRILDFWTKDTNANLTTATNTNWWRTSYDDGAGGWTDTGLGCAGSSTANPHAYSEYVEWSGFDTDFYMADLAQPDPGGTVPWEVAGGWTNPCTEDMIAIVGNAYGWWATTNSQGLVATVRVVYDEVIDPANIGWGKGVAKDFPVLGDFTIELPRTGDFNVDGDIDADDVDILCANMGGDPATYDLDSSGTVDEDDMIYLIEQLADYDTDGDGVADGTGTYRGDFDLNGVVNATDLQIMKDNFGTGPLGYADGNANCDTVVNATDLQVLKDNFGSAAAAVPEPLSMGLLAAGGLALLRRRK